MPTKTPSSNEDSTPRPKRRKHGYRGYPNNRPGGEVHSGTGFGGAGSLAGSGASRSDSGILTERTRKDVEKTEEEEK